MLLSVQYFYVILIYFLMFVCFFFQNSCSAPGRPGFVVHGLPCCTVPGLEVVQLLHVLDSQMPLGCWKEIRDTMSLCLLTTGSENHALSLSLICRYDRCLSQAPCLRCEAPKSGQKDD